MGAKDRIPGSLMHLLSHSEKLTCVSGAYSPAILTA